VSSDDIWVASHLDSDQTMGQGEAPGIALLAAGLLAPTCQFDL
jgi:hypothetical protein